MEKRRAFPVMLSTTNPAPFAVAVSSTYNNAQIQNHAPYRWKASQSPDFYWNSGGYPQAWSRIDLGPSPPPIVEAGIFYAGGPAGFNLVGAIEGSDNGTTWIRYHTGPSYSGTVQWTRKYFDSPYPVHRYWRCLFISGTSWCSLVCVELFTHAPHGYDEEGQIYVPKKYVITIIHA